jgi:hypothetical protein
MYNNNNNGYREALNPSGPAPQHFRSCEINIAGRLFLIKAGPYAKRTPNQFGVKMAAEITLPYDVSIPTEDYSIPNRDVLEIGLLKTYEAMLQGREVYVGCMGGIGRTGLFLAILAKVAGYKNPISYIRRNYNGSAVETNLQELYIHRFPVRKMRLLFWGMRARAALSNLFR